LFLFEDGVVVGWGMNDIDQQSLEQMIAFYARNPLPILKEDMIFSFGDKASIDAERDTVIVTKKNEWLEKVTYSFALARSVKLDGIEIDVEGALNKAKQLKFDSSDKASKQERGLKLKDEPRAELASLHMLSYNLAVRARVMEPPIYLWDKPYSFTELYLQMGNYFDFPSRRDVVQKKLELPVNYWTLENEHATSIMGWRLETMIIWLIVIEIIFHMLDKSEFWQEFSWEKGIRFLLRIPEPDKTRKKLNTPFGAEYEIVEEIYEVIEPKAHPKLA